MVIKPDAVPIKGMIFAGCSYTWGQGLYYYSNLSSLIEPPTNTYIDNLVSSAQKEFTKSIRYPRIVSDHFNSFELLHPLNGGNIEKAVRWWRGCLQLRSSEQELDQVSITHLNPTEISHIVFQLTQWNRNNFKFIHNGHTYNKDYASILYGDYKHLLLDVLADKKITLDQFIDNAIKDIISEVKQFLKDAEDVGIKTSIFTWPNDMVSYIQQDPWLLDRFITFDYKNNVYHSLEDMQVANRELEIKNDFNAFVQPPCDQHPSRTCHEIMAQGVIKHIESKL